MGPVRSAFRKTSPQFGWWFISPAFDPEWSLAHFIRALRFAGATEAGHHVGRRLADLVTTHPEQTLEILDRLMKSQEDDWLMLGEESVTDVLRSALGRSGEVREKAEQITNGLGARGYRQFRALLQ